MKKPIDVAIFCLSSAILFLSSCQRQTQQEFDSITQTDIPYNIQLLSQEYINYLNTYFSNDPNNSETNVLTNITISSEVVSLFSNIAKNSTNAVIQDDSPKWIIDEQIDQTIVKLRDLLLENGFDYSLSIGQAMDIISSLPNNKKEPLLFFLSTCYELNEYIQGTQTESF